MSGFFGGGSSSGISYDVVSYNTTTLELTASDTGKTYINDTSTASLKLPAASAGLRYTFIVGSSNSFTIIPASNNAILNKANGQSYASNVRYSSVTLIATSSTRWELFASFGTWA